MGSVGAVQLIVMVLVFEFGCGSGVRTVGLRSLDSVEEPLWHRSYRGVCSLEVQLWQEGVLMAGCRIDSLLGGMRLPGELCFLRGGGGSLFFPLSRSLL